MTGEKMDTQRKNLLFRISGIAGLIILLTFIFSLERRNTSSPHLHEKGIKTDNPISPEPQVRPSGKKEEGKRKVVYEAFQYGFSPDPLVVISGEVVELTLKSRDVKHGVMIPEIDFSAEIYPDKTSAAIFTAPSKPGKYSIFCSIFCGSGHGDMHGTLLVLPTDKEGKEK